MKRHNFIIKRMTDFSNRAKHHAFPRLIVINKREIIKTKHNILRWHNNRRTVRWVQHVIGRHHQHTRFKLRFERERYVNRHLVTVKVSIKRGTHKRMQLNGFTFNQDRLKRLNTKTVQRWRTVQHHRVLTNNLVQNIPNFRFLFLNKLLCLLHSGRIALRIKSRIDKRLEKLQCHLLRKTTLMQLHFRTNHDH